MSDAQLVEILSGGQSSAAGISVTPEGSLRYTAVLACVRVLAESVASLPLILYERQGDKNKARAASHPLYRLMHDEPNPVMTAFEWREAMQSHLCLYGNAYSEIELDGRGRVAALWPLRPDRMAEVRREGAELVYKYQLPSGEYVELPGWRVWHLRGLSSDGITGYSPIALARQAVGLGLATEEFGARWFGNGARPSTVLEHPGKLSDEAYGRLQRSWEARHQGLSNAHRIAILEEGMKATSIGIPPEDSQFLETRKFQRTDIAATFRVPPHMIGDLERATFSNIEHQSIEFVVHSLRPWLVRWEQAINLRLMTRRDQQRYFAEFLVEGLLRGDTATRYQSYTMGRQWGWLSVNDIRAMENMNPVEDGDIYLQPLNMVEAGTEPEPAPAPEPQPQPEEEAQRGNLQEIEVRQATGRRRRLIDVNRPAIQDAAQRVVNVEANDIGNAARRMLTTRAGEQRNLQEFSRWLREFLQGHRNFVRQRTWEAIWAMAQLVGDVAIDEALAAGYEFDPERLGDTVERFTGGIVSRRAEIWTDQLGEDIEGAISRAEADGQDPLPAVDEYLQHRRETKAESWTRDVTTAIGNAVAVTVWTTVGVASLRWMTLGDNCPYCAKLDGVTVQITHQFVPAGSSVAPDGHPPMTTHSNLRHPPLHMGCDCMVVPA